MTGQEARDDERATRDLVERMRRASSAIYLATDAAVADDISAMLRSAADLIGEGVILARKHPEPEITDEMVERAAKDLYERGWYSMRSWERDAENRDGYRRKARAILEAALRVPVGEGEQ